MKNKKSVTLIELIIAISLLGLVILSTTSIEMFARKQLKTTDIQTQLINEISPVIEHMVKNISLGIGDKNNPGVQIIAPGPKAISFRIRRDMNKIPADYPNEIGAWCEYKYASEFFKIFYSPNIDNPTDEVIAQKVTQFTPQIISPNLVAISITVRLDPTKEKSSDNPEVTIETQACLGSMSIS